MAILKNPKWIIVIAGLIGAGIFFFPESDEKYLKKTTLKMIDSIQSPIDSSDMTALMKRVRQTNKPMHFSVEFKLFQDDQILFKRKSVSEINSLLIMHFKRNHQFTFKKITKKDIAIQFSKENNNTKQAQVSFLINGQRQNESFNCQMKMDWKHEKKWLIYHITGLHCQGIR